MMNTQDWIATLCSGGSFICELAMKMLEINLFKIHDSQSASPINEILFYGAENESNMKQIGLNNLFCIYYVIVHASKSVEVCVPSLVSENLAKCLVNVHQKNNVNIRIIIHNSDNFHNLQLLAQNGIEVKVINPDVRLEHEFLLIDSESKDALAMMGSLDYETTRVNCNRDATVLTSETIVVTALKREFDRVWNMVSDIAYVKVDKIS